jgi:diguanylate cyclase (GGDEF)-like protein
MAKILVADDDLEIQELIKFTLENEGYEVKIASDGEEALKKVPEERPDLVLLDVLMPKLSGFEVCEKLRNDPVTCLIPIIMLTSLVQPKDRITGIKLGADEYLCKPFEPLELIARIEALLRRVNLEISISPLTNLPGNISIQSEIEKRLKENANFALLYMDIDRFKSFNDVYGFDRGDKVIRFTAALLRSCVGNVGSENTFIGHLGGDDFVIITSDDKAGILTKKIIDAFNSFISKQYDEEAYKKGYVLVTDRSGKQAKKYPLMSISIGTATIHPQEYKHYSEVIDQAKEEWKTSKKK